MARTLFFVADWRLDPLGEKWPACVVQTIAIGGRKLISPTIRVEYKSVICKLVRTNFETFCDGYAGYPYN